MPEHNALLELAIKRRAEAETSDFKNRERSEDDLHKLTGEGQWPEEVRRERESEGKPCITINGLPQFVRKVTGQIRQMNPGVKVVPADRDANGDVAELYEGLMRQIEYQSDAASVYEGSAESAAACGIGHFRLRADYCDGDTFDQEILIERIHNPFSVFWDPLAKHPCRFDGKYCFIIEEMRREDFKKAYPDATCSDFTSEHKPEHYEAWWTVDSVSVAEYYWIEYEDHTIGQLRSGEVVRDPVAAMDIIKKRTVKEPRVKWAKITTNDVLEGPLDIPGRFIPVLTVTGEEWHMGEEMYRSSVIRFAKDPQQLYNYSRSAGAELMGMQPKAPYLVTAKQVSGLEKFWNEANAKNRPYLPYNADDKAPPPMRVPPPMPSSAIMAEIQIAAEDMKRTTGIYDASLGQRSNETSGVAIAQRQQESELSTSIYADNMVKAIHQCGRIMVDWIPKIYDTNRVVSILSEDDQTKLVAINQVFDTIEGPVAVNDLTIGKYAVRIKVGPSYDTKREAASDGMMQFIQSFPQAGAIIPDLVAKSQDWPDAERIAERLRKVLPPGVVETEDMSPEEQQQMQMQAQQAQQAEAMAAQMQMAAEQLEMRKKNAEALEAEADAERAQYEARLKQVELAEKDGQFMAAVQQTAGQMIQRQMTQPYRQG